MVRIHPQCWCSLRLAWWFWFIATFRLSQVWLSGYTDTPGFLGVSMYCSASAGLIVLIQSNPRGGSKNRATSKRELFAIMGFLSRRVSSWMWQNPRIYWNITNIQNEHMKKVSNTLFKEQQATIKLCKKIFFKICNLSDFCLC